MMKDLGENLEKVWLIMSLFFFCCLLFKFTSFTFQEDVALRSMEERMVPLGQHLVKMEREVKRLQANLEDTEVCQLPPPLSLTGCYATLTLDLGGGGGGGGKS